MRTKQLLGIALSIVTFVASSNSQTITFEEIPGSTPTDGMIISNQFEATHGVSFSFESGGHPQLAEVGEPGTAFGGPPNDGSPDTPASGQLVGQFFLTDDGLVKRGQAA